MAAPKYAGNSMPARNEFRTLVEETASRATSNGVPLDRLHGTAFLDMSRDAQITALPSFEKALQAIISVPDFVTRFGAQEARRAVLQFVY